MLRLARGGEISEGEGEARRGERGGGIKVMTTLLREFLQRMRLMRMIG